MSNIRTPSFDQLAITSGAAFLTLGNDEVISVSNLKRATRDRDSILIEYNDGTPAGRYTYPSAAIAYENFQYLKSQLDGSGSTDAKLIGIFPNAVSEDYFLYGHKPITAIGENFPAGAWVAWDPALGSNLALTVMISDTMLYEVFNAAVIGNIGTYDVVLYAPGPVELYRLSNAFTVEAAVGLPYQNDDIWVALGGGPVPAPTTELPADQTRPCWFYGSSDGANYDTLYAWNPNLTSWIGLITV